MCYQVNVQTYVVIIMDTQFYNGMTYVNEDYPIVDVLHMIGLGNRPGVDEDAKCVIMCQSSKTEYLRKFIAEPLPIESHLVSTIEAVLVVKNTHHKQMFRIIASTITSMRRSSQSRLKTSRTRSTTSHGRLFIVA